MFHQRSFERVITIIASATEPPTLVLLQQSKDKTPYRWL